MSITIGDLKYQDTSSAIHRYMRDNFSWLYGVTVLDGVKGKSTVNGIEITGNLLAAADCVVDDRDTELVGKEIELDYYNLSFPIEHCDLRRTWLSAFASKVRNEEEVYTDALIPYLAEKVGDEVRAKVYADVITEATADADVSKVTLAGTIDTPANTYATVKEFINGLPTQLLDKVVDRHSYEYYFVAVSPEVYLSLSDYLGDKVADYGVYVNGVRIVADKTLDGDSMFCTSNRNVLVVFDDATDLAKVKIVPKEWLNISYIVTGLAFKGSYVNSEEIVISN